MVEQKRSTPEYLTATKCNVPNRTIFCHDNLDILQSINSECIDLIYLDPPFNTNKIFTAPVGTSAEGASFIDIFREEDVKDDWLKTIEEDYPEVTQFLNGIKGVGYHHNFAYLAYMAVRLIECHRILKNTGSLYLHCDPTMSHYLKIVLDCLFDESNFRNEIVWKRATSQAKGSQHSPKTWGVNTDTIFFYSKNKKINFHPFRDLDESERIKKFPKIDENGRRYKDDSAHIWRTPGMGARPNLCYTWRGFTNPDPSGWRLSKERLEEEFQNGNFIIRPDGKLERRAYEEDYRGEPIGNLWIDIDPAMGSERTGYPTQKPLSLLERIIKASSIEGDMILDPFCGCATACVAAEKLDRQWIGIDVSVMAYELVKKRLKAEVVNLFFDESLIGFKTHPLPRTDQETDYKETKFVYVISHPKYPGVFKVGIAKNWNQRLNSYQTSDPRRQYKMEFKLKTPYFRETEKHIHEHFEKMYERVKGDLTDIIDEIKNFRLVPQKLEKDMQKSIFDL